MTTRKQSLQELLSAIESGSLANMGYDPYPPLQDHMFKVNAAMRGSMDAAWKLSECVLPDWATWDASHTYFGHERSLTNGSDTVYACSKDNPARAWLCAILKALIAQEADT